MKKKSEKHLSNRYKGPKWFFVRVFLENFNFLIFNRIRDTPFYNSNLCFSAGGKKDDQDYIGCYTPACNAEYCVYCLPFLEIGRKNFDIKF